MIAQQRRRQQEHEQMMKRKLIQPFRIGRPDESEEEKVPTWSPPMPIVAFLIIVALIYGPEGFLMSIMFIAAFCFMIFHGKKNVKANEGLIPRNFQKK